LSPPYFNEQLIDATHFKFATAPAKEDPRQRNEYFTPCSPGDEDGMRLELNDIPSNKLLIPNITKVSCAKEARWVGRV